MFKPEVSDLRILHVPLSSSAEKQAEHVEIELTYFAKALRLRFDQQRDDVCQCRLASVRCLCGGLGDTTFY